MNHIQIQKIKQKYKIRWIPAFAGMTKGTGMTEKKTRMT